jgi:hypothetical protein
MLILLDFDTWVSFLYWSRYKPSLQPLRSKSHPIGGATLILVEFETWDFSYIDKNSKFLGGLFDWRGFHRRDSVDIGWVWILNFLFIFISTPVVPTTSQIQVGFQGSGKVDTGWVRNWNFFLILIKSSIATRASWTWEVSQRRDSIDIGWFWNLNLLFYWLKFQLSLGPLGLERSSKGWAIFFSLTLKPKYFFNWSHFQLFVGHLDFKTDPIGKTT